MAVVTLCDFSGTGPAGTAISAANTGAASYTQAIGSAVSTASQAVGSSGFAADFVKPAAAGNNYLNFALPNNSTLTWATSTIFTVQAIPGTGTNFSTIFELAGAGAARVWAFRVMGSGAFVIYGSSGQLFSSASGILTVGQRVRLESWFTLNGDGTGSYSFSLYDDATGNLIAGPFTPTGGTAAVGTTTPTNYYVGFLGDGQTKACEVIFSNIRVSSGQNTYIGPLSAPPAAASGSASFTLTASAGAPKAAASGSASFALTASGSAGTQAAASGAASFTLNASAAAAAKPTASASFTLNASNESPVQTWLRTKAHGTQYIAHRNGAWATYGEETREGYNFTAAYHSQVALEISFWVSSDGVYVASHDQNTSRVFGQSYDIPTTPWATLQSLTSTIGHNPIATVDQIIADHPGRIFVLDNKSNSNNDPAAAHVNALCPGRWIAKGISYQYNWLNSGAALGAPGLLYFYPSDLPNMAVNLSHWTGTTQLIYEIADYSASGASLPVQSDANTFYAFTSAHNIMSWTSILNATAQRTNSDSQASTAGVVTDGYMMSNVAAVIPGDAVATPTASASFTLTAQLNNAPTPAAGSAAFTLTASISGNSPPTPMLTNAGDFTWSPTSANVFTITGTKPANVADGDVLIAVVMSQIELNDTQPDLSTPSPWVRIGAATSTDSTSGRPLAVYALPVPSAAGLTATSWSWTQSGSSAGRMGVLIFRLRNADMSVLSDATTQVALGANSITMTNLTTPAANDYVFLVAHVTGTSAQTYPVYGTPPAGMAQLFVGNTQTAVPATGSNDGILVAGVVAPSPTTLTSLTQTVSPSQSAFSGFVFSMRGFGSLVSGGTTGAATFALTASVTAGGSSPASGAATFSLTAGVNAAARPTAQATFALTANAQTSAFYAATYGAAVTAAGVLNPVATELAAAAGVVKATGALTPTVTEQTSAAGVVTAQGLLSAVLSELAATQSVVTATGTASLLGSTSISYQSVVTATGSLNVFSTEITGYLGTITALGIAALSVSAPESASGVVTATGVLSAFAKLSASLSGTVTAVATAFAGVYERAIASGAVTATGNTVFTDVTQPGYGGTVTATAVLLLSEIVTTFTTGIVTPAGSIDGAVTGYEYGDQATVTALGSLNGALAEVVDAEGVVTAVGDLELITQQVAAQYQGTVTPVGDAYGYFPAQITTTGLVTAVGSASYTYVPNTRVLDLDIHVQGPRYNVEIKVGS